MPQRHDALPHPDGLSAADGDRPRRHAAEAPVIVLDGDGSLLMGLGALATAANDNPKNLGLIVFDNEVLSKPRGPPSATARKAHLAAIARASGVRTARPARTASRNSRRPLTPRSLSRSSSRIIAKVERTAPEEESIRQCRSI